MPRIHRNQLFVLGSVVMVLFLVMALVTPAFGADAAEDVTATETDASTDVVEAPAVEEAVPEPAPEPIEEPAPGEEPAPAEPVAPEDDSETTSGATEVVNTTATGTKAKILKAPKIVKASDIREQRGGGGNPNTGGGNATGYSVTYVARTYNATANTTTFTWILLSSQNTDSASHVTLVTCLGDPEGTTSGGTAGTATYGPDPSLDANPTGWKWGAQPAPGETFTLTFVGNIPENTSSGTTWYVKKGNDNQGSTDETGGNTGGPSCTAPKVADVEIKKQDNPDSVDIGEQIQYTLTVTNHGPDEATDVVVTDELDDDVTFDHFETGTQGCDEDEGTITCALGDLDDDEVATIVYYVAADGPAGTVSNTATVATTSTDTVTSNDSATETTEVKAPETNADVSITKSGSLDRVFVGGSYNYMLVATNNGPDAADNVTVRDVLPTGVTFGSYGYGTPASCGVDTTPGTIVCNLGTLDANESVTIVINVTAPSTPQVVSNTATIETSTAGDSTENNSDTETTTIVDLPDEDEVDLKIEKSDSADPLDIDDGNLVYTLEVTNDGPADARDVIVTDDLPADVDFVSADHEGCFYIAEFHDVFCFVGDLDAEDSVTIHITVSPQELGLQTNTATVDMLCFFFPGEGFPLRPNQLQYEFPPFCDLTDSNPENNSDTETTLIVDGEEEGIDLAITKTDHRDTIELGSGNLTYELVVTNVGDETAFNVVVEDQLPDNVDFVGFGGGDDCSYDLGSHSVTCWVGTVTVEDTITRTIEVTPTAEGTLVNDSEVHSLGQVPSRITANQTAEFFVPEANLVNNFARDTTVVTRFVPPQEDAEADLSITKTDSADPVQLGDDFSYTLDVFNHGPNTAQSVIVTDVLPVETELITATSSSPGVTCSSTTGALGQDVITCHLSSLAPGTGIEIDALVHAAQIGAVVNTASVSALTPDPDPSDNTDSEGTVIGEPPVGKGTIVIQKQTLPDGTSGTFHFTGDLVADLGDDESASLEVDPGIYTVSEESTEGWELTRVECVDSNDAGTASVGSVDFANATFNVEEGETVTCVFTNTEVEVLGERPDDPDRPDDDGPDERPATRGGRALPFTGWVADDLPELAVLMILLGFALLDLARRRRTRSKSDIG